jgi:hypothetical protein
MTYIFNVFNKLSFYWLILYLMMFQHFSYKLYIIIKTFKNFNIFSSNMYCNIWNKKMNWKTYSENSSTEN